MLTPFILPCAAKGGASCKLGEGSTVRFFLIPEDFFSSRDRDAKKRPVDKASWPVDQRITSGARAVRHAPSASCDCRAARRVVNLLLFRYGITAECFNVFSLVEGGRTGD